MRKKEFQAAHQVVASTPLGPIVEFSFRGEDDVSRGDKIRSYLEAHIDAIQPAALVLNFFECRQFFDAVMGSIISAFIDRKRSQNRPCAVLATGRTARSVKTLLELTTLNAIFDVGLFEEKDSAVAYLHESIGT